MKTNLTTYLLIVLWIAIGYADAQNASFELERTVTAGGGITSAAGPIGVNGTAGQPVVGVKSIGGSFVIYSGFWTPDALAPTAARVNVSGHVNGALSNRLAYTIVSLLDVSNGSVMTTLADTRGRFIFVKVEVGKFYVVSVQRKGFTFTPESVGLNLTDEVDDLIFNTIPEV